MKPGPKPPQDSTRQELSDVDHLLAQLKIIDREDNKTAAEIYAMVEWAQFSHIKQNGEPSPGFGSKVSFFKRAKKLAFMDLWTELTDEEKQSKLDRQTPQGIRQSPIYRRIKKALKKAKEHYEGLKTAQDVVKSAEMVAARKMKQLIVVGGSKQQQMVASKEFLDRAAPKPTRNEGAKVELHIPQHVIESIAQAGRVEQQKKLEAEAEIIDVTPEATGEPDGESSRDT